MTDRPKMEWDYPPCKNCKGRGYQVQRAPRGQRLEVLRAVNAERKRRRWTLTEFSHVSGVPIQRLTNYFNGNVAPPLPPTLERLVNALWPLCDACGKEASTDSLVTVGESRYCSLGCAQEAPNA